MCVCSWVLFHKHSESKEREVYMHIRIDILPIFYSVQCSTPCRLAAMTQTKLFGLGIHGVRFGV